MTVRRTKDKFLVYDEYSGSRSRFLIHSYQFEGCDEVSYEDFNTMRLEGTQYAFLKCMCGSNNWNDDGRVMHEYCCGSCGKYVKVYRRNENAE